MLSMIHLSPGLLGKLFPLCRFATLRCGFCQTSGEISWSFTQKKVMVILAEAIYIQFTPDFMVISWCKDITQKIHTSKFKSLRHPWKVKKLHSVSQSRPTSAPHRPDLSNRESKSIRFAKFVGISQDMDFSGFYRISIYPPGNEHSLGYVSSQEGIYTPAKLTASFYP